MSQFVRGTILDTRQRPVGGVLVRALDKDLPSLQRDELLGEPALTNDEGAYEISFPADRPSVGEYGRADIYIEVLGTDGAILGRSATHFNAELEQRIDLTIETREPRRMSEYEELVAFLMPLIEPLPLADLTPDDVEFLVADTGADRSQVSWIAAAAQLARRTGVPAEAFYGWARSNPPVPKEWDRVPDRKDVETLSKVLVTIETRLVATATDELIAALLAAIKQNIIPSEFGTRAGAIVRALSQALDVSHQALVRLVDDQTGAPLAKVIVRILDLESGKVPDEIGRESTSDEGLFALKFGMPPDSLESSRRLFRLTVLDAGGNELWSADVPVAADEREVLEFKVRVPRDEPHAHGLSQVAVASQLLIPEGLLTFLGGRNIHTLGDIRRAGGLGRVAGLPIDTDVAAVAALDAHADLIRVSSDVATSAGLMQRGFRSVADIAATPLPDFVSAVHETLGDFKAAKMHVAASAETGFLHHVLTGLAVERANGFRVPAANGADRGPDAVAERCGCDDCDAAVSPTAYLADLLRYAATHLKEKGGATTVAFLEATFHQPFGRLPTDCEAVAQTVRQVRICVEVLRAYIKADPIAAAEAAVLTTATGTYLLYAYTKLLEQFGTSYPEIRLARGAASEERLVLADRLGIDLTVPRPDPLTTPGDELDQLFLEPDASSPFPRVLTEPALDRLFGLVDTTRDPLSDGVKIGDSDLTPELAHWQFSGARRSQNTDPEGVVHLRVRNVATSAVLPRARTSYVDVYRDAARKILVAAGNAGALAGNRIVKLDERNSSGLSGSITVSGLSADNTDISIALVPKVLYWRLRNLRTIWRRQDFPTDPYSSDYLPAADRRPVVDPDVIGPDDFRRPSAVEPLFALWTARRQWMDKRLQDLSSPTKTVVVGTQTLTGPDLDKVLAGMYSPSTYAAATMTPWLGATPASEFDALGETLERGEKRDVLAATHRIWRDLNLTVDAFLTVVRLTQKQRQWLADPKNEMVQSQERDLLFSILAGVQKERLFGAWIQEETAGAIRLGPEGFWRSEREPREGQWPPTPAAAHPLIDPDEVRLVDLPEPTVGKVAIQIWEARRVALADAAVAIRNERQSSGFDAMLRLALGHPASADPLQHDLPLIKADLTSSNPATVSAATMKVTRDLHLTVESFNQLMTTRERMAPAAPRKPTDAEWAELYAVLTTAHKAKHLYPEWTAEENTAGLSAEYWRAIKARLPPGRATAEARRGWRDALDARSQPAIVDPDLVDTADFKGVGSGAALAIWQARHDWVKNTLMAMAAQPTTLGRFDTIVEGALSIPVTALATIVESREKGERIQPRLEQLLLTNAAFVFLVRVRDLLAASQPVTTAEWESVYSILVQVLKRRRAADWREEERLAGVSLSPDFFVPPAVASAPAVAAEMQWRASQQERYSWLDTLQSRVDQERGQLVAFDDAVGAVEETTLPALRDALVAACGVGPDAAVKAAWVTDRLGIDAKAGACQKTTRIAQAMETIQGLLFAARTAQSAPLQALGLTLAAPNFDEEWRWIGSYAPWRAAMFVVMYPENIAIGSLRRRQTPAFRKLVRAVRGTRRLNNDQACALAAEYAAYYEDIAKLAIGATCQAIVTQPSGTACVPGVISRKPLVFMFGRGGVTNGLYWSTFDPADTSGHGQSFWDLVPGAAAITAVVGAGVYERSATDRRVFLFIRTIEHKLQFLTFDLDSRAWAAPTDLGLPAGDAQSFDIVINQHNSTTISPILAIRAGSDFYVRSINREGTNWAEGDWKLLRLDNNTVPGIIGSRRLFASTDSRLWVRTSDGYILERYPNANVSSMRTVEKNSEYIGAVLWGKAKRGFAGRLVQKRTDGVVTEDSGLITISERFEMSGLKTIVPNCGYVDFASFAYERRNDSTGFLIVWSGSTSGTAVEKYSLTEKDGLYLRLVELEDHLTTAPPIRSAQHRIAPPVMPSIPGQFSIPARLEGAAADARRNTVKITLSATGVSATNRTYAEEAFFFVPMLLSDGLGRAGEHLAALDWVKTVHDYTRPAGQQKIYHGLVQEESLSEGYLRTADWLRDPLDPHAIAATRRLTYTRFTLLSIARLLLAYADAEFTRDTSETVPRARTLYLAVLRVLDSPELKQHLGRCDDVIGQIEIALGPDVPASAMLAAREISRQMMNLKDYTILKEVVPRVSAALVADTAWDERVVHARRLVEEAVATEAPVPNVAQSLELGVAMTARAVSGALASPTIAQGAERAGHVAGSQFLTDIAAATALSPTALESGTVELPWLSRNALASPMVGVDFVLRPDLQPVAPPGSATLEGLLPVTTKIPPPVWQRGHVEPVDSLGPRPAPVLPSPPSPPVVPSLAFCVPPNPLLGALRLHAELNLFKLRTCRNIAGMKRELDPYVAATDTVTGLPTIGADGQLVTAGATVLRPTLYRFAVLVQRAKELIATAQQMESAMLSAFEKRDAEAYSMFRARQDLELAQAGVQLQVLRVKQANDGVTLASLQQTRAQIQLDHYQKLLDEGTIGLEQSAITMLKDAATYQGTAADLSFATAAVGAAYAATLFAAAFGGGQTLASAMSTAMGAASSTTSGISSLAAQQATRAQMSLTLASFERRRQEWELSSSLAKQDVAIGDQQVALAVDSVEIAKQEKIIAEVRNTHASDTVAFLANKFTNVDLYDWMSGVLENVYSFFLQQATSTAKLAENQLAFQRQEPPAAYIRGDYWQGPDDSLPTDNIQGATTDRRGLTGSARLLQDLYRLDQYAFDTDKRKLQLSKTVSLALSAPAEFQRFRETGVLSFATPMGIFDRDFPGHYLRLIKSVRTSIVALIPPVQGIHATLSSAGVSRVVIGSDVFQKVPIRRDPELVALSSPMNASGVFELEAQTSGMLLPFEGSGVDTTFELRMPKAANFLDYRFVQDVLVTYEYTSLHSWDYAQQVMQSLRQSMSGELPLSFRNQLADQWYDLHNPELTSLPMTVRFRTVRDDFPPNLDALKIQHVALYFSQTNGSSFEVPVSRMSFVEDGSPGATGGAATSIDGIISTRRGNAGSWMSFIGKQPFGEWELSLPNTEEMRQRFSAGHIQDILFIVTYSGQTHDWPA